MGTVVHLALEELSQRSELPDSIASTDRQRWRAALSRSGLWGDDRDRALARVEHSLNSTLRDPDRGRWMLSSRHARARSEWALTRSDSEGGIQDMIIDRCFLDTRTGIYWLLDYKTSQPLPEQSLTRFLAAETAQYRDQLLAYRDMLRELATEPIRCALYFTALGHFHPLPELDLPARK